MLKQEQKRFFTTVLSLILLFVSLVVTAQVLSPSQYKFKIQTPGKKSRGHETYVEFQHKRHVDEFNATCEMCHPAIIDKLNAPGNTQKNVHNTCRQCHAKNKPGKTFICSKCHKK